MANPIARMSQYKRPKIQNRIGRHADSRAVIGPSSDIRPIRLHAGHAPLDLMALIINMLFTK
jgi:hypothetical protein